eukprot:2374300-Rhodomonas_salina.1
MEEGKPERLGLTNPRCSAIVTHNGVTYLTGQTSDQGDIKGQTQHVLQKIDALLEEAGTNKSNLLTAMIWVKDIARDFSGMNEVGHPFGSTSAFVGLSELDFWEKRVLIDAFLHAGMEQLDRHCKQTNACLCGSQVQPRYMIFPAALALLIHLVFSFRLILLLLTLFRLQTGA